MKLLFPSEDEGGFTLLEMLIATLVISMIILSSHTLLEQLMQTGKKQISYNKITTELTRSRTLFERDVQEIMIDGEHPLNIRLRHDDCTDDVAFYTHNMANPDNTMSAPFLRVNWLVNRGKLIRRTTKGQEVGASGIITYGVKCLQFRLYTGAHWTDNQGSLSYRPKGIAFKIIFESGFSTEAIVPE